GPAALVDTKPGGTGKSACVDTKPPQTTIDATSLKNGGKSFTVRGRTTDNGCKDPKVAKKRNAIAVVVTIAKHESGRCRYLERDRRLGSTRSCRLYTLLRASGKYSLA